MNSGNNIYFNRLYKKMLRMPNGMNKLGYISDLTRSAIKILAYGNSTYIPPNLMHLKMQNKINTIKKSINKMKTAQMILKLNKDELKKKMNKINERRRARVLARSQSAGLSARDVKSRRHARAVVRGKSAGLNKYTNNVNKYYNNN